MSKVNYIGQTFAGNPLIVSETPLVNVFQCEKDKSHNQTIYNNGECLACAEKEKKE